MKVPFKIVSLQDLIEAVDISKPVFLDCETVGKYGTIRLVQAMQKGWKKVLLVEWPNETILMATMSSQWEIVFHNLHYDWTTAQQQNGNATLLPKDWHCTLLLSRLAFPEKLQFSLDAVLKYISGFDPYLEQGLNKKILQKTNWGADILSREQLRYAATDVYFMPQMWKKLKKFVKDESYLLDKAAQDIFMSKLQWTGMPVDTARLHELEQKSRLALADIKFPEGFNYNSPAQTCEWLDIDSSADLVLAEMEIRHKNKKAAKVRKARKLSKLISFCTKCDKGHNQRIFGKFAPLARSGRATCEDENLQQTPRLMKVALGFPDSDPRVLIYSDYAQVELRTICAIVRCIAMEALFREGADLHSYTVMEMLKTDKVEKAARQMIKTYNFNLLYIGGAPMLQGILLKQVGVYVPIGRLQADIKKWKRLWKEIKNWQEQVKQDHRAKRLRSTPLGRKYMGRMVTDHANIENQGSGAEVAKMAMVHMRDDGLLDEPHVEFHNFIHDSFILSAPDEPKLYKDVSKRLATCMQKAWFDMSENFAIKDLPMPVTVSVGKNWGDIEDDDIPNLYDYELDGMKYYGWNN